MWEQAEKSAFGPRVVTVDADGIHSFREDIAATRDFK
jgi:hypothetical protein